MVRGTWPGRLDGGLFNSPSLVSSPGRRISQGGLGKERPQIPPESLLSYQKECSPRIFSNNISSHLFLLCLHSLFKPQPSCSVTHALLSPRKHQPLASLHRIALVDTNWSSGIFAQLLRLLPNPRADFHFPHTNDIILSCHHVRLHGASGGSAFIHSRED